MDIMYLMAEINANLKTCERCCKALLREKSD